MKSLLLATTALVALVSSAPASAADLRARPYTKAPPPVIATIDNWSGFYVGFNAGGGSSRDRWNLLTNGGVAVNPAMVNEGTTNAGGAAVGGQIGYRYQLANWVFGVEAQGDWSSFKGSNRNLIVPTLTDRTRVNGFGLFTGQVGYSWNNVLWYVKGGAAFARGALPSDVPRIAPSSACAPDHWSATTPTVPAADASQPASASRRTDPDRLGTISQPTTPMDKGGDGARITSTFPTSRPATIRLKT